MFNPKVFVAEFVGTFALVLIGSAAGLYGQSVGLLGVALAHGLTLAVFAYIYGHISGTHINPAVTLGLAANGTIKWGEAVVYWVAQFAGAAVASLGLSRAIGLLDANAYSGAMTSGLFVNAQNQYLALGIEALLTFFLVTAVLQVVDGKAGQFGGWVVGTTLSIAILAGGPLTGASLNPARSFGPALFTQTINPGALDVQSPMLYLIFFVGPFLGSIVAVLLHQFMKYEVVLVDDEEIVEEEVEVEQVEPEPEPEPVRKPRKSPARSKAEKS